MLSLLLVSMETKLNDNFIQDPKCMKKVYNKIKNLQKGRKMVIT